jgi:hypothetical protein
MKTFLFNFFSLVVSLCLKIRKNTPWIPFKICNYFVNQFFFQCIISMPALVNTGSAIEPHFGHLAKFKRRVVICSGCFRHFWLQMMLGLGPGGQNSWKWPLGCQKYVFAGTFRCFCEYLPLEHTKQLLHL